MNGRRRLRGVAGLLLAMGLLLAQTGRAAAPPVLGPIRLTAEQQRQIAALLEQGGRAAVAGRFEEVEKAARRVAALHEKWQGKRHWETTNARWLVERWRRLTKVSVKDRSEILRALILNSEGRKLQRRGRSREAELKDREVLAIRRKVLGEDHPETAMSYNDVADCLDNQGKHADAFPLRKQALAIRRKVLGEDHLDTADSYTDVAFCLNKQGKHADALPLLQKALAIRHKMLGEYHPSTAAGYKEVAVCLESQGKHADALPLYEKALAIRLEVLGEDHPATATSYNNLAVCLNSQRKHADALPLYKQALAIRCKVLGEDHPHTAGSYNNVAACLNRQGKHADALPLFQKALAIRRKVLGEDHPDTASSYNGVAVCLDRQGKHADALPLHKQALAIRRKVLGEDHPDTASSYNNLAVCLHRQGKHADALPLHKQALAIRRKVLAQDHPDTARSNNNVAACLSGQGKHADALPLYKQALAIFRKALGEDHPDTALSYNNVASCLNSQGKHADALPLFQKALAIWRKALGEDHPYTATIYNGVAACLDGQGKHADSLPLLQKALAIWRKVLGEDHPDAAIGYNNVAACLQELDRLPEAVLLLQASLSGQEAARFHSAPSGFDRALAARHVSPHALLALGLAQLKQPRNAFRHAEASLARALLDDLARSNPSDARRIETLSGDLRNLDDKFVSLLGREKLSADQERLREELTQQRRAVSAELARLAAEVSARQLASLEEIQAVLPVDAALLLWLDEQRLRQHWACVVRRDGPPAWVALPGRGKAGVWSDDDLSLADRCYRSLTDPGSTRTERDRLLADLQAQRVKPLRAHLSARGKLPAVRRLFVVPTGDMAHLPVETLAPECAVSIIPSGSVLVRLLRRHRPLSGDNLLALGDPVFGTAASPLPEPPARGLMVSAVLPGSAAARAGLQPGDVLLSFGTTPLENDTDLKLALSGGAGRVHYWRDGKFTRTLTLAAVELGITIDPLPSQKAVKRRRELDSALTLRGTGHNALPGTMHEVKALAALVKNSTTLLGSDASEQRLDRLLAQKRLQGFRLLHFATHGEVDNETPDRSSLILAQDRLPDPLKLEPGEKSYTGELTVKAIRQGWDLDADLVVLSACQTALGKDTGGDGLLGFAQAFLSRGARCVVLSRWKVDDGATGLLMVRFYENLLGKRKGLTKPMGRALALQEAKDWLRTLSRREAEKRVAALTGGTLRGSEVEVPRIVEGKKPALPKGDRPYQHPFYWAAFLLSGDPD